MRSHAAIALIALASASLAFSQPANVSLYAPFDGSASAAVALGNASNLSESVFAFAPGLRGEAVELGAPCRFETARNFSSRQGTLAMWLRPHWPGNDPGTHYLFCIYGAPDLPQGWMTNRFSLQCGGGRLALDIWGRDQRTVHLETPIDAWAADEWHHVAVSWEGINPAGAGTKAVLALYVDGKPVARDDAHEIAIGPQNSFFDIGNDQDNNPKPGNALVDDLFIYDRALTVDEIAAGVAATQPGGAATVPATVASQAATGSAGPRKGWWDSRYPFRSEVVLPPSDQTRHDAFIQSRLHLGEDINALGLDASVEEASVRVVEVTPATGAETGPLPLRVSDGIAEWSAAGVTPAKAERHFRLYFRTNEYVFPKPLVSQRQTAPTEALPEPPQVPDYATEAYGKPWDFADDLAGIDQWGNKPEYIQNRKVEDHVLSMDVQQDPWFIWGNMWGQVGNTKRKVAIDLDRYPVLEMKVRQSVPSAKWQLYGRVGQSDNLLTYEWPVNGTGWQRVRIDLRKDARWKGVLSAFRIDPTDGVTAHVDIAWVRLAAVTTTEHGHVETLGNPSAAPARIALTAPGKPLATGAVDSLSCLVTDAAGKPVSGQPVTVSLKAGSGGELQQSQDQRSLALSAQSRSGLTDSAGHFTVKYTASRRPGTPADTVIATAPFSALAQQTAAVNVVTGPPHHFVVTPAQATAVGTDRLPVTITAQVSDAFDNPIAKAGMQIAWAASDARLTNTQTATDATGKATVRLQPDYAKRWVYTVSVAGGGLSGQSGPICLVSDAPRPNPVKLGKNLMYQTANGKPWLALGGFYANWVGLPQRGAGVSPANALAGETPAPRALEEGRQLISFTDATEEQMIHWLDFLHRQGVTAMRFMLRTHRPNGMEPMDIGGRVNMDLFAKALRYMDLARPFGIRFMLTIHEDYTKPVYYDTDAFTKFALPKYAGENLDALPPFQRRFIRDRRFLDDIAAKYTDPDVIACQDQYARQLIAMLKGNPQVFAYELENEMVDCPASWANHAMATIRSVDPSTLICVSHGGGGLETADPLWWRKNTTIDFYTYHLYAYPGSVTPTIDYGCAVDMLTRYGRMAAPCQMGESSGDEFEYHTDPTVRRYVMRDIIWFSLVNGNPGCFFWNARGFEVEQFRLAGQALSGFDFTTWKRAKPDISIKTNHPLTDDKYYRTLQGHENHAMMGRYINHYLSEGVDFDFTANPRGAGVSPAKTADLTVFAPPEPARRLFAIPQGWQLAYNAREGYSEGFAYIRNIADIALWEVPGKAKMWLRTRKAAPLTVTLNLSIQGMKLTAIDLDTGEKRETQLGGKGQVDLGTTDHDWALVWKEK